MTGEGHLRMTGNCDSELLTVIPNAVRNLRSPSDGRSIPPTTHRIPKHLRFFGVRASE